MGASVLTTHNMYFSPGKQTGVFLLNGDATLGPVRLSGDGLPVFHDNPLPTGTIHILHMNDLHGMITRPVPNRDEPVMSRIASSVRRMQAKTREDATRAFLFLSAGDDIAGSMFDRLIEETKASGVIHPSYALLAGLGLSAAAIGNHDLDYGELVLYRLAGQVPFPLLSANLTGSTLLSRVVHPAALFQLNGLRIGIIGLTTQQRLKRRSGETWSMADPVRTMANLLPAFRPLCDVVILLSHLGYQAQPQAGGSFGDVELARALPPGSVDLIIGAHSHDALNEECLDPANIVNGIPILQAGAYGRYIGEATVQVKVKRSFKAAAVTDAQLIHTADCPVDEDFERQHVRPLMKTIRPFLDRRIGRIEFDQSLQTEYVRQFRDSAELALANFISDALHDRCHENGIAADLVVIDNSVLRAGLPAGEWLTLADWYRVMPFTDTLQAYELTGSQLLDVLCDIVFRLGRWDEPVVERGFAHFSRQVRYGIMQGRTRRDNVLINPLIRGVPLGQYRQHRFLMVTHSHFRAGAISWENRHWPAGIRRLNQRAWPVIETDLSAREETIIYIEQSGGVLASTGAKTDRRLQIIEPESDHEDRHVFHQPLVPRQGDGGSAETLTEYRYSLG